MRQLRNLFRKIALLSMPVVAMVSCATASGKEGVALEGTMKADSIDDFILVYNEDGDITRSRSIELRRDSLGRFQVPDSLLPKEGTHAQLLADDSGFFGVWLQPGKTAIVDIKKGPDGKLSASFSGDNDDINTFFNDMTTTFDIMVFSPQDPSDRKPYNEMVKYLGECQKRIDAEAAGIKDAEKQKYYRRYAQLMGARMKGFLIEDRLGDQDLNPYDDAEYRQLVEMVDSNEDLALETGMIYLWLNSKNQELEGQPVETAVRKLKVVDSEVRNKRTHKALYNMVPYQFFAYSKPTPQQAADFMKAYGEMAKAYPELIDIYTFQAQGVKEIKTGDALSYDPEIVDMQGNRCRLSSLFGNKIVYIDFWATWCGPCCKQIPHLERMATAMKDVPGIEFVSISSDSDVNAWKAKVRKDNPEWPQYIFAPGEGDKFMAAMNITGIPRFMIIGRDGKIIEADATMPSDPKTQTRLRELAQ